VTDATPAVATRSGVPQVVTLPDAIGRSSRRVPGGEIAPPGESSKEGRRPERVRRRRRGAGREPAFERLVTLRPGLAVAPPDEGGLFWPHRACPGLRRRACIPSR
jgi:hypothetical protein